MLLGEYKWRANLGAAGEQYYVQLAEKHTRFLGSVYPVRDRWEWYACSHLSTKMVSQEGQVNSKEEAKRMVEAVTALED